MDITIWNTLDSYFLKFTPYLEMLVFKGVVIDVAGSNLFLVVRSQYSTCDYM